MHCRRLLRALQRPSLPPALCQYAFPRSHPPPPNLVPLHLLRPQLLPPSTVLCGPLLASISDFWLFKQCITANLHYAEEALLNRNASKPGRTPNIARIGPNLVVTNDPDLRRHMSLSRSRWTRSGWYSGFEMGGKTPHVFAERDEGRHKDLRGKLGNGARCSLVLHRQI